MQAETGADAEPIQSLNHPVQTGDKAEMSLAEQKATALAIVQSHLVRAANWFYWIAGLSLVNLGAITVGANFRFIIGLGFSELLGGVAKELSAESGSNGVLIAACAGGVLLAAFFGACGWFARRPSMVAFIVGMVVFGLDTFIFIFSSDWLGVAFHVYATYCLWRGVTATRQYKAIAAS